VLERREKTLGRDHPDTLRSMDNLGLVLSSQERSIEAETMHRQAIERKKKTLGHDHPDMLISMNDPAITVDSQGRPIEAEPTYRQVLEGSEKRLSRNHPDTLRCMENVGLALISGEEVAIKFFEDNELLLHEARILEALTGGAGIPSVREVELGNGFLLGSMVLSFLSPALYNFCDQKFTLKIVLLLAG